MSSVNSDDELIRISDKVISILEANQNLSRQSVVEWFNDFIKLSNNNLNISKKKFIEFYKQFLPKNGNPDKFCEFVFRGWYEYKSIFLFSKILN